MTHLNVAVRVRPLSESETRARSVPVVEIIDRNVAVTNLKVSENYAGDSRERVRRFSFDYCFDTTSTQEEVFEAIEKVVADAIKQRYHTCVFAYGQSSSGKTHTIMGVDDDQGLTPRLCERVFDYVSEADVDKEDKKITVSYLEIYNEKVKDLLRDEGDSLLRVREHPKKGTYVQGLSHHVVSDSNALFQWLQAGNKKRRVSATSVNRKSSRSHSVFTITCFGGTKLTLVDLAGSERTGSRSFNNTSTFREGANINKSLVALGNVIFALADQSKNPKATRRRYIPYRDSVLTWLLKDTLGGNSRTIMIATISPANSCYSETINTLRFGHRAKQIIARPISNEDPKQKIIRDLKAEIANLKKELLHVPRKITVVERATNTDDEELQLTRKVLNGLVDDIRAKLKEDFKWCQQELLKNNFKIFNVPEFKVFVFSSDSKNVATSKKLAITERNIITGKAELKVTEKLIPVMDVSATETEKPVRKLRRTFSVSSADMEAKRGKMYGSYETLSKVFEQTQMRKRSLDKLGNQKDKLSTESVPEKVRSGLAKVEAKVDSIRKTPPVKPRSEIVAAVTQRLYTKIKKKEVATETDDVQRENKGTLARIRLQDITQRALRACRRKHADTQTEAAPVLRLKEVATDVQDLKLEALEVKDANVATKAITTKDAGVNYSNQETFGSLLAQQQSLLVTKSCGVQVNSDQQPNLLSFTKYLRAQQQQQQPEIASSPTDAAAAEKSPIYTSAVNINVSHSYINRSDSVSGDSLEDSNTNAVGLSTPDLISNHNSLEPEKAYEEVAEEYCDALPPVSKPKMYKVKVTEANPHETLLSTERPSAAIQDSISDRILEVMTKFLKEATTLMTNLTNNTYDLQITVTDQTVGGDVAARKPRRKPHRRRKPKKSTEIACQTCNLYDHHVICQTSPKKTAEKAAETIPENKYEFAVRRACDRLERCADVVDWYQQQPEDSSMESNVTFSDYGSLPRPKLRCKSGGGSPRAFLRELTTMRKQIVDLSREELGEGHHESFIV